MLLTNFYDTCEPRKVIICNFPTEIRTDIRSNIHVEVTGSIVELDSAVIEIHRVMAATATAAKNTP